MDQTKSISVVNKEISKELTDPHIVTALLKTTFPGFDEKMMRQAIFEGMIRGFQFKNFLQKDVYAIKYGDKYSLITSIDYARKMAKDVWLSRAEYEMDGTTIVSCTVTAYRRIGKDVAQYPATVFFDEYTTNKNLWTSKPKHMIMKVATMHALRAAVPQELAKLYTEEEFDKEKGEEFDTEGIDDNTEVTVHVGEDHGAPAANLMLDRTSTDVEPEMPETDEERLNLIKGLFVKKWPDLGAGMPAITKKVKDFCGVPLIPENYQVVINMLR